MTDGGEERDDPAGRLLLIFLPIAVCILHWSWTVRGIPPYGPDTFVLFPLLEQHRHWAEIGRFPLWSGSIFNGQPVVLQSEPALLHPLRLPLLWLAGVHGEGLWLSLHSLLGAFSMFAYCRVTGLSRFAAVLAAYAVALGGFFSCHTFHAGLYAGAALIPAGLLCCEQILRGRRPLLWTSALALFSGLQWVSGHAQVAILTAYYLGLYAVLRSWVFRDEPGAPKGVIPGALAALALVLGLGLAAYQIVPLFEVLEQSDRAGGLDFKASTYGSLPPWGSLLPLFPAFYGTEGASDARKFWLSSAGGQAGSWEFHCYAGAAVGLLFLYALARHRGDGLGRIHLVLLVFSLLFAWGKWGPTYWLLWRLPGIHSSRVPARAVGMVFFSMIYLAAIGLDGLRAGGADALRAWRRVVFSTLVSLAALWLVVGACVRLFEKNLTRSMVQTAEKAERARFVTEEIADPESRSLRIGWARHRGQEVYSQLRGVTSPLYGAGWTNLAFLAAAGFLLALLAQAPPGKSSRLQAALIALSVADLLWFANAFGPRPTDSPDPRAPPPYAAKLDKSMRLFSLVDRTDEYGAPWDELRRTLPVNMGAVWDLDSPDGDTSTGPGVVKALFGRIHLRYLAGPERLRRAERSVGLLQAFSVGYLLGRTQWGPLPWPVVYEDSLVRIWRVPGALPRQFLSAIQDLDAPTWMDTVMAKEPSVDDTERFSRLLASLAGNVTVLSTPTPDTAEFEVESRSGGTLVRTERMFRGWQVSVDGESKELVTALGFFQSVRLPAGRHRVRFEFHPPALRKGAMVSGLCAILVAAVALAGWRRRVIATGIR